MADVDFNYFLNRKYALLQQQADAGTSQAQSTALSAAAGAKLDTTRAALLPAESKATIGQTNANANLLAQQAGVVAPEAFARIRNLDANTGQTAIQAAIAKREGLDTQTVLPSALQAVTGGAYLPSISDVAHGALSIAPAPSGPTPSRRIGESDAAYLDRINGL